MNKDVIFVYNKIQIGGTEKILATIINHLKLKANIFYFAEDSDFSLLKDANVKTFCVNDKQKLDDALSHFDPNTTVMVFFYFADYTFFRKSLKNKDFNKRIMWCHYDLYYAKVVSDSLHCMKGYQKDFGKFIFINDGLEKQFKKFGIQKTSSIENPLTFTNDERTYKKDNLIIWVGRLDGIQKKPQVFLEVINKLQDILRHNNFQIEIIGPDDNITTIDLEKKVSEMKLNDIVSIIGPLSEVELNKKYEQTLLLCSTSSSEGNPTVFWEAIDKDVIIVSNNLNTYGSNPFKDGTFGHITRESNNQSQMVDIISDIITNQKYDTSNFANLREQELKRRGVQQISQKWNDLLLNYNEISSTKGKGSDFIFKVKKKIKRTIASK